MQLTAAARSYFVVDDLSSHARDASLFDRRWTADRDRERN
jgi:hypothetical protein